MTTESILRRGSVGTVVVLGLLACGEPKAPTELADFPQPARELALLPRVRALLAAVSAASSERQMVATNTHIARWAYHTASSNVVQNERWYISYLRTATLSNVYALGPLSNGQATWWTVGTNVATFTSRLMSVAFAGNLDNDPSDRFIEGVSGSTITDSRIHGARQEISGKSVLVKWYFFEASNGNWYIVNEPGYGTTLRVLRFATKNGQYDWQPVNVSGLVASFTPLPSGEGMSISFLPSLSGNAVLSDGTTTPVSIRQFNSTAPIDASKKTWVVIHGRLSTPADVAVIASALRANRPAEEQVLVLDWQAAAQEIWCCIGAFSAGEQWIEPVGYWAGGALMNFGFDPGKLQLVGHSWGSYVADELAEATDDSRVKLLVALDPAINTWGSGYKPYLSTTVNFGQHSLYSVAFHASTLGSPTSATTAHEAFVVQFPLPALVDPVLAHSLIKDAFAYMIRNESSGGVSGVFALNRLVNGTVSAQLDKYDADCQRIIGPVAGPYEGCIYLDQQGKPLYMQRFGLSGSEDYVVEGSIGVVGSTLRTHIGGNANSASAIHRLYTTPIRTVSASNPASFTGVPAGTYLLEGYSTGTFFGEEFWTSQQVTVTAGQTTNATLTRNYPFAENVAIKNDATGALIASGQSVPSGTTLRAEVTVRNNVPGSGLSTTVRILWDRDRLASYDRDQPSLAQTVGGGGGTSVFTFTFTPSATGQLYWALEVQTTIPGGNAVRTDAYDWTSSAVVGTSSAVELIANGGFEALGSNWVTSGNAYFTTTLGSPHAGSGYAFLGTNSSGGRLDNAVGSLYQQVTVPSSASSATLRFWYRITTDEVDPAAFDVMTVTLKSTSGTVLRTIVTKSNRDASTVYSQVTADLSLYVGQTIRISFASTSDNALPTVFRIDDVSLTVP